VLPLGTYSGQISTKVYLKINMLYCICGMTVPEIPARELYATCAYLRSSREIIWFRTIKKGQPESRPFFNINCRYHLVGGA
jgi:hypothetical protein